MDSAALTSDEADFTPLEDAPSLARSDPGRLPTCGGVSSAIALLPRDEPGPGVGRDPERAGKCSDWPTSSSFPSTRREGRFPVKTVFVGLSKREAEGRRAFSAFSTNPSPARRRFTFTSRDASPLMTDP